MARLKDETKFGDSKTRLLMAGMDLIRSSSFSAVGINDVLKTSKVPRGSFYHYFPSKEAFGIEVAQFYHEQQLAAAQSLLSNKNKIPLDRLIDFFASARKEFKHRKYSDGCLMCNLSSELADSSPAFQKALNRHWQELTQTVANCLKEIDLQLLGLGHLSADEAADWLMNAWSGALVRMKASRSDKPLSLFEKTVFCNR